MRLRLGDDDGYRAVLASEARMDLILAAATDVSQGEGVVDALVAAVSNGTLDDFDAASQRIADLEGEFVALLEG